MAGSFSSNAARPSPGSWLHTWLAKRSWHPDSFDCGVRVVSGRVEREGTRWRYRRSAVDRLITDGVVTLYHGSKCTLRLAVDPQLRPGARAARLHHVVLCARELDSGADVQISVSADELGRFGLDPN